MATHTSAERWTDPRAVVVGSVEWRCVGWGDAPGDAEGFEATGQSGRSARGPLPPAEEQATMEERLTAGLCRIPQMTWIHPENGEAYTFRLEPGAPPRVAVSSEDGGIHIVALPPGRFLAGLGDKSLQVLVQQAVDQRREANWASEGGAVAEPGNDESGPEL